MLGFTLGKNILGVTAKPQPNELQGDAVGRIPTLQATYCYIYKAQGKIYPKDNEQHPCASTENCFWKANRSDVVGVGLKPTPSCLYDWVQLFFVSRPPW